MRLRRPIEAVKFALVFTLLLVFVIIIYILEFCLLLKILVNFQVL